jgi:hypothetical protein
MSIKELQGLPSAYLQKEIAEIIYTKVLSNLAYSKMRNGMMKTLNQCFWILKIVESIGVEPEILYKRYIWGGILSNAEGIQ